MPTKPVTSPAIWASNANWTVGPHAGQPTKVTPAAGESQNGHVGGQTFKGQHSNYLHNLHTTWITNWLALGSSAGAADAHIVETDSSGATSVRSIDVIGGSSFGVRAVGTLGAGPATGVIGIGVGAPGVTGTGGNAVMSGVGNALTGGVGVRGLSGTTNGTAGVLGIGNATGDHPGVEGRGSGTGPGLLAVGGGTAGHGVEATSGTVTGDGVRGTALGNGSGVFGTGSPGVQGTANDTTANFGVNGSTLGGSDSACAGVRGSGVGDATGVLGVAVDGYAMIAQPLATTRGAIRVVPQASQPGTAQSGDLYYSNESVGPGPLPHDELRVYSRGSWRSVMVERLGYVRLFAVNPATVTATTTIVPITVMTPSLAAPGDPRRTGTIYIRIGGELRRSVGGTTQNAILRVVDVTAGVTIDTRTFELFQPGASALWERCIDWTMAYALPAVGPRDFRVEIETTNGAAGSVGIRDASMQIYGVV